MSIQGTSFHDPAEWEADKREINRCQHSIICQNRTISRADAYVRVIKQSAEKIRLERQKALSLNAMEMEYIGSLSVRMDDLEQLEARISEQNSNTAAVINQLVSQKREAAQCANDWYNEAIVQFTLMESNPDYQKFAESEMIALRARIQQCNDLDWSAGSMQAQAERLLSDVYLIGLQVIERRKQYDSCQTECVKKAMEILEQASEFRNNGEIYGYYIGRDVDYWTSESLKRLETEVESTLKEIESKCNDSDFQARELQAILSRLNKLYQKKEDIIDCALENARRSERTQAEVRLAADTLVNHGFRLVGANYELGDERRPFIARMRRDSDNMEVEFVCGYDIETNEYKLVHTMNSSAYSDVNVRSAIQQGITQSIIDAGGMITFNNQCTARELTPFNTNGPVVDAHTSAQLNVPALGFNYE